MRRFVFALLVAVASFSSIPAAGAGVLIKIDKSSQRMDVYVDGEHRHSWPVSTARRGYVTPNGVYRPKWLARYHRSRKYHNSPMPFSIFFAGGYAIHGSYETRYLGRPASHGCVRLYPAHAARLFRLVQDYGKSDTRIVIRR
jgi:lipoprotein-anchoring transpeptidase ErfK/SrfK